MYTDPTGTLQDRLGMTYKTLDPGKEDEKGEYSQISPLKNGLKSAKNGLKSLPKSAKPGQFDRLGGEFVFDVDEGELPFFGHLLKLRLMLFCRL